MVIEGRSTFSKLTEFDSYMGQSTGKYSLLVTLDDATAETLENSGVRVKTYQPEEGEPVKQRKFSSKFDVRVMDAEGNPFNKEIPWNSLVRLKYKLGNEHPVHGMGTYLEAVKILEMGEDTGESDDEDF